jgi:hypothetical protein
MNEARAFIGSMITLFVLGVGVFVVVTHERTGSLPETESPYFANSYENKKFGFTINFPEHITPEFSFSEFHNLKDQWRYTPFGQETGTSVVTIPILRIDQEAGFPRFFLTEIRIGTNSVAEEVVHCLDHDIATVTPEEVDLGGRSFFKFPIQDSTKTEYLEGESYRAVLQGECVAIERIRVGSNHGEDELFEGDITPDALIEAYALAGKIIDSIDFTE